MFYKWQLKLHKTYLSSTRLLNNIPEAYIKKLEWKRVGNNLEITNHGAYYINFNHIAISGVSLNDVSYIAPFGSVRFALPEKMIATQLYMRLLMITVV